jgi:hypothetical protein
MPKEIPLSQGRTAIVDEWNYDKLRAVNWYYDSWGYAARNLWAAGGKRTTIRMHRVIMGLLPGDPRQVDHINHNRLDNRETNLRVCTHAENTRHQQMQLRPKSSRYKGVSWDKGKARWRAQISFEGKIQYLGRFHTEVEAAQAYNDKALELFGEFAHQNAI